MPLRGFSNARRDLAIKQVLDAQSAIFRAFHEQPLPDWLMLDITLGQLRALFVRTGTHLYRIGRP